MEEITGGAIFKLGTETVTDENGVNHGRINGYVDQIYMIPGLIIVTSGAEATGRAMAPHVRDRQVLAGIGSAGIVMSFQQSFGRHGVTAAQVLATDREMSDPTEGGALKRSLEKCRRAGVVPIFNTNDMLNEVELAKTKFKGENDGPAAHITALVGAELLALVTKHDGLWDDNNQRIVEVPYGIDEHVSVLAMVKGRSNHKKQPHQGILAKCEAAIYAARHGSKAMILGRDTDFAAALNGESGTLFLPKPVEWKGTYEA